MLLAKIHDIWSLNLIMMQRILIYVLLTSMISATASAQVRNDGRHEFISIHTEKDSVMTPIPDLLPSDLFIPRTRLIGIHPWTSAPLPIPVIKVMPVYGFDGSIGFGEYSVSHPDKFFSTLDGRNRIDIPQLYITEQMLVGNTFRLAKNFYMLSAILYGAQLGIMGNNWGMGNREGFIWHPSALITIVLWNQYFQSVSVYSPVLFPNPEGSGAAIRMPATPEVFSFGVQANFIVGEFIIGIGTSITPKPFDKKESRYR